MKVNAVPFALYTQNIISALVLWVISCLVIGRRHKKNDTSSFLAIIIILVLYSLTFLDSGIDGVNRWISVGAIRLYISSILIPILIILLWEQLNSMNIPLAIVATSLIAIILLIQPDASQLTSFCIPMILILFIKIKRKYISIVIISILTLMIASSWVFLDSLPPVSYVENIIGLVFKMGFAWSFLGIISILILLLPFQLFPKEGYELLSRCIGLYYLLVILSTFVGNFPVPLMGFGISPIIGYFIAITWLFKSSNINIETRAKIF